MFWCWHVVLLKNSCPALLSIPSFNKLSARFDLPGLWQSHNKETCNMNQWYISVSQRMQAMEIPVIGCYWTSGNLGLGKRSSYQFHCSKQSPFFVPLKPLIAMAVTFGPQFWDHPRRSKGPFEAFGLSFRLISFPQALISIQNKIPRRQSDYDYFFNAFQEYPNQLQPRSNSTDFLQELCKLQLKPAVAVPCLES